MWVRGQMASKIFDGDKFKAGLKERWSNSAPGWLKWEHILEAKSNPMTERIVHYANIKSGQRVLDIATGTGEPALTVARLVGEGGQVTAIDQSPNMIELARKWTEHCGITNATYTEIDAELFDYSNDTFDAVVSRCGLMFMPILDAVLNGIHQTLKPGGRFATAV